MSQLVDPAGRPLVASPRPVVDRFDGYDPAAAESAALGDPRINGSHPDAVNPITDEPLMSPERMDGFVNAVSGLGDPSVDKAMGGAWQGADFAFIRLTSAECAARYRGIGIGKNAVDIYPDQMTRRGWDVEIQLVEGEEIVVDPRMKMDAIRRNPLRAAAGWRDEARRLGRSRSDAKKRIYALERARRWDAVAAGDLPIDAAGAPPPGPLPEVNADGATIGEEVERCADKMKLTQAIRQALIYERAFGGGCVFIGVDDGGRPLTDPLDWSRVKRITHLTPLRGGWDGPVTMWRPYRYAISEKYGQPEIFQVANQTVPIAPTPAPGEVLPKSAYEYPPSPSGPTLFYVHESRFLIFDGEPATTEAQQTGRGWGDSVFTRAVASLADFGMSWQAASTLMQTASIDVQGIPDFTRILEEKNAALRNNFIQYALLQSKMTSVTRIKYIDSKQTYDRKPVSFSGIPEILRALADRIAADFDVPVSILLGNLKGGLGAQEDPSLRSFYDRVEGRQELRLRPQLRYFFEGVFRSKLGPTRGREPAKWDLFFRPLWQLSEMELADLRTKTVAADVQEIQAGILDPEEVASTRYGGVEYNTGPIMLDMDKRRARELPVGLEEDDALPAALAAQPAPEAAVPAPPAAPASDPAATEPTGGTTPTALPIHMMPTDPIAGDPQGVQSVTGPTATVPGTSPKVEEEHVVESAPPQRRPVPPPAPASQVPQRAPAPPAPAPAPPPAAAPTPKNDLPPPPPAENAKDPDAALNGAQVSSLREIVASVARRELPRESGVAMMLAAFPITREQAEGIMGPVGRTFFVEQPAEKTDAAPAARADVATRGPSQRAKLTSRVAAVIARDIDGRLLLGKRRDNGRWTLPAGHLEPGEAPAAAASRELLEESGLQAQNLQPVGDRVLPSGTTIHVFTALVAGEPSGANDPDREVEEWRFVDVSGGLPAEYADNLHGPAEPEHNVVLATFGRVGDRRDSIDLTPPAGAREEAQRGLDWRREHGRGGTPIGIARARDIAGGKALSEETIARMVSFFARHEVDKKGEGWSPGEDGYPSNGRIAWALWGGDAGKAWAEKVARQLDGEE